MKILYIVCFCSLFVSSCRTELCVLLERYFLPSGTFDLLTLVKYTGYCFVSTLPVLAFMLLVSSRCENIWFTLGIGVAGLF